MNYGLWASDKEPGLEPAPVSKATDNQQLLWDQLVKEVHRHCNYLRSARGFSAQGAFRHVREQVGIKMMPWQSVIKKDRIPPAGFEPLIQEALFKLQDLNE